MPTMIIREAGQADRAFSTTKKSPSLLAEAKVVIFSCLILPSQEHAKIYALQDSYFH